MANWKVLIVALAVSVVMWIVIANAAITGHTKMLKTAEKVVLHLERAGDRARGAIHHADSAEDHD